METTKDFGLSTVVEAEIAGVSSRGEVAREVLSDLLRYGLSLAEIADRCQCSVRALDYVKSGKRSGQSLLPALQRLRAEVGTVAQSEATERATLAQAESAARNVTLELESAARIHHEQERAFRAALNVLEMPRQAARYIPEHMRAHYIQRAYDKLNAPQQPALAAPQMPTVYVGVNLAGVLGGVVAGIMRLIIGHSRGNGMRTQTLPALPSVPLLPGPATQTTSQGQRNLYGAMDALRGR